MTGIRTRLDIMRIQLTTMKTEGLVTLSSVVEKAGNLLIRYGLVLIVGVDRGNEIHLFRSCRDTASGGDEPAYELDV